MKKTFKRLGAMFLAMVMAVSVLCTGAFADNETSGTEGATTSTGHTISVDSEDTHTYLVYQIFTGDYSKKNNEDATLSNIKWGQNGQNKSGSPAVTVGELVSDTVLNDIKTANDKTTDKEKLDIITPYANTTGTTVGTAATEAYAEVSKDQTKTNVPDGYYLIKDKTAAAQNANDTTTTYIVKVVGENLEITRKASVPKVEKKIIENNTKLDATTAKVGDVVNFELTGDLPQNYADYTSYKYVFHDTLSKGLTYNGNLKVYVKNGSSEEEVSSESYGVTVTNSVDTTPSSDTSITVTFNNLKATADTETEKIVKDTNNKAIAINAKSKIIVRYSATLNENAVVGSTGNENKVQLEYSNDPNDTTTGKTEEQQVKVYTFQLNVVKIDGATKDNENPTKLEGAKFKLYYEAKENDNEADNTKHYAIVSATTNTVASWTDDDEKGSVLTTDSNGNITVKGLKTGTYYLDEIEAPAGYNKLANPVKVVIVTDDNTIYNLKSVMVDNNTPGTVNGAEGTITIANSKGSNLPSTGGMGTKLFYTVGGLLMAGAAIVLVIKKRRSSAE